MPTDTARRRHFGHSPNRNVAVQADPGHSRFTTSDWPRYILNMRQVNLDLSMLRQKQGQITPLFNQARWRLSRTYGRPVDRATFQLHDNRQQLENRHPRVPTCTVTGQLRSKSIRTIPHWSIHSIDKCLRVWTPTRASWYSFCRPLECNGGPAGGNSCWKILGIMSCTCYTCG